jgi:hypothetical protein
MEQAFEAELLELAIRQVERQVKPKTWKAFSAHFHREPSRRRGGRAIEHARFAYLRRQARVMKRLEHEVKKSRCQRSVIDTAWSMRTQRAVAWSRQPSPAATGEGCRIAQGTGGCQSDHLPLSNTVSVVGSGAQGPPSP